MSRKSLLTKVSDEQKEQVVQTKVLKEDSKLFRTVKRELEEKIDDLDDQINDRLSIPVALDRTVIEVLFHQKKTAEALLELYEDFQEEYYNDKSEPEPQTKGVILS